MNQWKSYEYLTILQNVKLRTTLSNVQTIIYVRQETGGAFSKENIWQSEQRWFYKASSVFTTSQSLPLLWIKN